MAHDTWCDSASVALLNAADLSAVELEIDACDMVVDALTGIGFRAPGEKLLLI
jgi:NAD(P)H-hydrate repair Nnr-like enzyme with NAD(P)H-hydrate epimerase domain